MKLSIIGGGNMGSAIARGVIQGTIFKPSDVTVIDISETPLKILQDYNLAIRIALNDYDSVNTADIVILAVKPWLIRDTIADIKFRMNYAKQLVVSVAAGVTIDSMNEALQKAHDEVPLPVLFRLVPNTAVCVRQSITLIASQNASS